LLSPTVANETFLTDSFFSIKRIIRDSGTATSQNPQIKRMMIIRKATIFLMRVPPSLPRHSRSLLNPGFPLSRE
jgi:hypothetical protein